MKIFVINLSSATEKRETMKNTLDQYTKEYIFFEAIDGKNVKDTEYTINLDWFNPCGNNHTTCGEIGCALSHYSIWKMMIDENIEQALILEDDVIFHCDFETLFSSKISKVPLNWKLLYLGSSMHQWRIEQRCRHYSDYLVPQGSIPGAFALGIKKECWNF